MPLNATHHLVTVTLLAVVLSSTAAADDSEFFEQKIRPVLAKHCFSCHSSGANTIEAGLLLDFRPGLLAGGESGPAAVPGKPDDSEVIARISADNPDLVMPPPESGPKLSGDEITLLREWITSGAAYGVHWSFTPPVKGPLPTVQRKAWPRHAIDSFVLAKLEQSGLTPAAQADRYRLIRRVSLDITGLPPTPEEADAFARDTADNAFDKVVDRLLESDAYGEHWARMWLDLARYADTKGYEKDRGRTIWRFRDWVIEALNRDLPFDEFTTEQLAGDLLENPTSDQLIATAFHRNTMTNDEGGTDNEEFRVAAVKDRVDTTIQVWMGLTMGCAKCHSHKYDPISNREYYRFYSFFNQTEDADRGDDAPVHPSPTQKQSQLIASREAEIKAIEQKLGEDGADAEALKRKLEAAKKSLVSIRSAVPRTPVFRELPANRRRKTHMHIRGNFLAPGDLVAPGVPQAFGTLPEGAPLNRLGVSRWLTQPENPLTARVMVNRIWARLFGTGIVETEEDFGAQGLPPSHPELLDWLAVDFRENGWSVKQLLRTIVLSATYRQSAVVTAKNQAADPANRLLSRGPRFRLSAEVLRDQALAVSGLMTHQIGGPSVMPPQPDGVWKSTYNAGKWINATGPNRYRRALYTYWKRTSPYPAMLTFDAGTGEVCQIRRVRTNTPLQALVMLNDPVYIEAAGALARRISETQGTQSDRISRGFRLVLTRSPAPEERTRLHELYTSLKSEHGFDKESAGKLAAAAGWEGGDAALIAIANVLLNLDETLMKP